MEIPFRLPSFIQPFAIHDSLFLEMGVGESGLKYEKAIYKNLVKASQHKNLKGQLTDIQNPAGNDWTQPDVIFAFKNKYIFLEVKSKLRDSMGNFSVQHVLGTDEYDFTTQHLDYKSKDALRTILQRKSKAIDNYIQNAKKQQPLSYNGDIDKFPMYITVDAVNKLRERGYDKAIADYTNKDVFDAQLIARFYNDVANTFYVQIGGWGVYYMGEDKYKLGVPPLKGKCFIEIRPFKSGAKERKDPKTGKSLQVYSLGLRVTPKIFELEDKSTYNFDTVDSIVNMFSRLV